MTQFTSETARTFEHGESIPHTVLLAQTAQQNGCTCEAYVDWFTYRRWSALGFQVQKGEKGTKLSVFRTIEKTDAKGQTIKSSVPWRSTVFCRCQIKPKEAS